MSERDRQRIALLLRLRLQNSLVRSRPASPGLVDYVRRLINDRQLDEDVRAELSNEVDGGITSYRGQLLVRILRPLPAREGLP